MARVFQMSSSDCLGTFVSILISDESCSKNSFPTPSKQILSICWISLDIRGCSPRLSHTVDLAAIGYGARLSSLRSVSFRFLSFRFNKFFLPSELKPTKLLSIRLSFRPLISLLFSRSVTHQAARKHFILPTA